MNACRRIRRKRRNISYALLDKIASHHIHLCIERVLKRILIAELTDWFMISIVKSRSSIRFERTEVTGLTEIFTKNREKKIESSQKTVSVWVDRQSLTQHTHTNYILHTIIFIINWWVIHFILWFWFWFSIWFFSVFNYKFQKIHRIGMSLAALLHERRKHIFTRTLWMVEWWIRYRGIAYQVVLRYSVIGKVRPVNSNSNSRQSNSLQCV